MTEGDWNFPEGRFLAYALGPLQQEKPPLYIVLNAAPQTIEFLFPTLPGCSRWGIQLNTAAPDQKVKTFDSGSKWQAPARSVLVFSGLP
jgi:glycogen operon protein